MIKIVLFGIGSISKLLSMHIRKNVKIIAYLADNESGFLNDIPIVSFENLKNILYDYIVIAFGDSIKGIEILRNKGIPDEKIIGYAYTGMLYQDNVFQIEINNMKKNRIKDEMIPSLFDIPARQMYLCDTNVIENEAIISKDFIREQTLSFLGNEIYRKQIKGCVLEIGVSEGEFARKINYVFYDRKLYLFDTYAGLPDREKNLAISLGWGEKSYALNEKTVSAEKIIATMPHKDMCIIKKGIFPDSCDLNEKIAFASLDIDFYDSTKRSLEAIYPQLSRGGYIMVHDFNNIAFGKCRNAVTEFCDENNIGYVPIADKSGTVILTKT